MRIGPPPGARAGPLRRGSESLPTLSASGRRVSKPGGTPPFAAKAPPSASAKAAGAVCVADMYDLKDVPLHVSDTGRSELRLAVHRRTCQPAVIRAVSLRPPPPVAPRAAIELWRRLDNRHVAALFDSFTTPTHAIVCMEAVHGVPLDEVMRSHGLTNDEARAVFKQVAHGVASMHRARVCHRTLSLKSVMLQEGAVPRAVIIGLESLAEADDLCLSTRCTPIPFCPPEALPNSPSCTAESATGARGTASTAPSAAPSEESMAAAGYSGRALDVWSLGALLHALLTGCPPFADGKAIAAAQYTPPAELPAQARELVALMLQADASLRPSAAAVCAHPYVSGCDVEADETDGLAEPDADVLQHMVAQLGFDATAVTAALGDRTLEESDATSAYRCLVAAKRLFVDRCVEGEHAPPELKAGLAVGAPATADPGAEPSAVASAVQGGASATDIDALPCKVATPTLEGAEAAGGAGSATDGQPLSNVGAHAVAP